MFGMGYAPEGFWEVFDWIASNCIKYALAFMLVAIGLFFISKFTKTIAEKKKIKNENMSKIKAASTPTKKIEKKSE